MKKFLILGFLGLLLFQCLPKKPEPPSYLPYPKDADLEYYQAQADSGNQVFWLDLKAVASAYLNNSEYWKLKVGTDKFVIVAEGLFDAKVEIELPDYILNLYLIRPFQQRGHESIWQVVKAEKEQWSQELSE